MDGTPELVLVLLLACLTGAGSTALFRVPPSGDQGAVRAPTTLVATAAVVALSAGGLVLRFGAPTGADLRSRAGAAIGAGFFGVGSGLASHWWSERLGVPGMAPDALGAGALGDRTLRGAARTTSLSLAIAAGSAAVVALFVGRGALPHADALVRALSAWALGALLVGWALGVGVFPLAALAVSAGTAGSVAARAPAALGPMFAVLGAIAVSVGAASVQIDPDESPDAPWLRGFAVTTAVGTLAAASVSLWWARGAGGVIAVLAAAIGTVLTLLLGRYHDDPTHRPARSLADVRGMDATARWSTGAIVGLEGFLGVAAIAALVALAAERSGELSGVAAGGSAVAIGTVIGTWGFLRALAGGEDARTLAHDTLLLALIGASLARRSRFALLFVAVAAVGLLWSAILERTATADPEVAHAGVLRRRAGTLTMASALVLSLGGTVAALLA